MVNKLSITELDFLQIKANLIDFFRGRPEFADYDFEGAGLNLLMELLAVNTHYMGFYANMAANEAFIDSAQLRESVVSLGKMIGYTPYSNRAPVAYLTVQFFPSGSPTSITLAKDTLVTTSFENKTYNFRVAQDYVIFPDGGEYIQENVKIIEGDLLTHRFTVTPPSVVPQRFVIPNAKVDTDQITVTVQESNVSTVQTVFTRHEDLNQLGPNDAVYFLQECEKKQYEITFGDGAIGKALVPGNIVIVEYAISTGSLLNGVRRFSMPAAPHAYTITVEQSALGGAEQETIESIRKLAPLNYETQNRAVTKADYEVLVKTNYPVVEFVRAWGGEENDPPQYGRVFICIKPTTGLTLTVTEKEFIQRDILEKLGVVAIQPIVVDADFLRIVLDLTVTYRSKETTLLPNDIETLVRDTVQDFSDTELLGFAGKFKKSLLTRQIDEADTCIQYTEMETALHYRYFPVLNQSAQVIVNFSNELDSGDVHNDKPTLSSDGFTAGGLTSYLADDGDGNVYIYRLVGNSKLIYQNNVGTLDYTTGKLTLNNFAIESIPSGNEYIDIKVKPERDNLQSVREQILIIEDEDVTITIVDESTED